MQKAMNFNDVAIVSIKGSDHRIHFWYMSRNNAIDIMKNYNLIKKVEHYNFFFIYKNEWKTYYQKNREVILYRFKEYYKNNKEILR